MTPPVSSLAWCLAATGSGAGAGRLGEPSELELVARSPGIATAAAVLLLAGLAADVWLLWRLTRARAPGTPAIPDRVGPKPWGLRELVAGTGLLVLILLGASYTVYFGVQLAGLGPDARWVALLLGELGVRALILIGAVVALRPCWPAWMEWLGLQPWCPLTDLRRGGVVYLASLPAVVLTMVGVEWVAETWQVQLDRQPVVDLVLTADSGWVVGLVAIFAVVMAPVFEETFFRGFAYPALTRRFGTAAGLVTSALLFGLAHFHLPSFPPLFVLGLALGLAYQATGSLVVPIVVHALFNAGNLAMLLGVR